MLDKVTLSERDVRNADKLRKVLDVKKMDTVVSSSLDVTARLADILKVPGSRLYLRKRDGSVRRISLQKGSS